MRRRWPALPHCSQGTRSAAYGAEVPIDLPATRVCRPKARQSRLRLTPRGQRRPGAYRELGAATAKAGCYETGRPRGSIFTAQRPEFVSAKNTWPLKGCTPHTMVALGVYPAGDADLKTAISRPWV